MKLKHNNNPTKHFNILPNGVSVPRGQGNRRGYAWSGFLLLLLLLLLPPLPGRAGVGLSGVGLSGVGLSGVGSTTLLPQLQRLGTQLLKGHTGSIVAMRPDNGEVICLVTNTPTGPDNRLAIATAYPPGSTFKTAEALMMLSCDYVSPQTQVICHEAFREGNIRVACHKHPTPLSVVGALGYSCNTWFLRTFLTMMSQPYQTKEETITLWYEFMQSMGLGGPTGIDLPGEKGGLLANEDYLSRRYKDGWNARTIMWIAMGQGDITVTPLQLCLLATTIANRGWFYTPHIHRGTPQQPLPERYLLRHETLVDAEAYIPVITGMRLCVKKGTTRAINTPAYAICGKTGTAENSGRDHSAFIGFAPMNNPQIAIAVYIEHGGFGADCAAPIAAKIIKEYIGKN